MATVLVAGIIGGEIFALMKMPKVTGWIVTGIVLRSFGVPGLEPDALARFAPFNYFVLGYIAFTVGATLHVSSLRNTEKRIGLLLLCEALITPLIVGGALLLIGPLLNDQLSNSAAILLAAIAIAGAPGTTVLVVQEARARGILTRTLVAAIGLIDMVAVAVFVLAATFQHEGTNWVDSLTALGVQFGVTFLIGSACACIALLLTRTFVSPAFLGPTMVAVILCSWGAAAGFGTSGGILACTFAGMAVTNIRHDTVRSAEAYLHSIGSVLFATFYTFAGMKLDFAQVPAAAALVALYFIARLLGKCVSAFTAMKVAGVTANVRNYLGLALMPHGGVAVGLIILIQNEPDFSGFQEIVTTVGLAALAINQLLGPSATRFALQRAGEDHKDQPRLLDFLGEHRIRVGLKGNDKTALLRELVDLLYATAKIDVEKDQFVENINQREDLITTCVGDGLMIPHAIIESGSEITGVLGISSEGLDLGAPDGRPIHAILLLATPEADRRRHLEVLAAFATA
ncbi:MAG: PTS fructose transporter subunit IIA, partial [Planctomycetaceae bacterium]|nr:PTS fructose transporter subunit IIA [Planctomycetaceae bacterium]